MRSKQQKMGFSRSTSQHGSATVGATVVGEAVVTVGAAVGAAVVTVGAEVGAVGAVVGLLVGQSVPRFVPLVLYSVNPLLRGTSVPHSPALSVI